MREREKVMNRFWRKKGPLVRRDADADFDDVLKGGTSDRKRHHALSGRLAEETKAQAERRRQDLQRKLKEEGLKVRTFRGTAYAAPSSTGKAEDGDGQQGDSAAATDRPAV